MTEAGGESISESVKVIHFYKKNALNFLESRHMVNSDSQNRKKSIFQTFFTNMSYDFLKNRTKMKFKTKKKFGVRPKMRSLSHIDVIYGHPLKT